MIWFLCNLGWAQDKEEQAEPVPAVAEPAPAEPAPAVAFDVGPIVFAAKVDPLPRWRLEATDCLATLRAVPQVNPAVSGDIGFEVVLKRGRLELVTATTPGPAASALEPCLRRELASIEWPIRKGRFEVPLRPVAE